MWMYQNYISNYRRVWPNVVLIEHNTSFLANSSRFWSNGPCIDSSDPNLIFGYMETLY